MKLALTAIITATLLAAACSASENTSAQIRSDLINCTQQAASEAEDRFFYLERSLERCIEEAFSLALAEECDVLQNRSILSPEEDRCRADMEVEFDTQAAKIADDIQKAVEAADVSDILRDLISEQTRQTNIRALNEAVANIKVCLMTDAALSNLEGFIEAGSAMQARSAWLQSVCPNLLGSEHAGAVNWWKNRIEIIMPNANKAAIEIALAELS